MFRTFPLKFLRIKVVDGRQCGAETTINISPSIVGNGEGVVRLNDGVRTFAYCRRPPSPLRKEKPTNPRGCDFSTFYRPLALRKEQSCLPYLLSVADDVMRRP